MPKNGKTETERNDTVLLGVWIDPELRSKGQAAIKILGYNDMTKFVEEKLREAIDQAQKQFSK